MVVRPISLPPAAELIRFGAFELDLRSRELRKDGRSTGLPEQSIKVLHMLLERPGELILRDEIRARLWPNDTVVEFDHSINAAMRKLRVALGDSADSPRYIETLARRGYRWIGPVESMSAPEHIAALPQPAAEPERSHLFNSPLTGKRVSHYRVLEVLGGGPLARPVALLGAVTIAAVAALGVTYFALDRLWMFRHPITVQAVSSHAQHAAATAAVFNPPPHSIAVLPLANESGEASQQYFSDGISEDLITALSQFPELKVIGRTSAFQFRDSKEDSRSIGAKLGVAHLLEGSVRRSGEMVRVSAELIDTADGSTQWSERYDRPYKDLFALQDEITSAVAGALREKLLPGEHGETQSERPPGGSLEAYNAYLQGRFFFSRQTEADYHKAIESYTHATQIDPHYAFAWSGLSSAWTWLGNDFLGGIPAQESYAKAREAALRALALSPELATAHVVHGHVLRADLDWRGAGAEYRRALELAPNDPEAKFYVARHLATFGEVEPAIELARQEITADPLRADWYDWLAIYLSAVVRLDEAEQAIHRAIELQPNAAGYHWDLVYIEVQRGDPQAALAAAQQESPGHWQDSALALARQIGGDRRAADAALRVLIDKHAGIAAHRIAEVYAVREDATETFKWLDRAWGNREASIAGLRFDPFILRFKDDPRFAAFCRKVGLPVPGEIRRQT